MLLAVLFHQFGGQDSLAFLVEAVGAFRQQTVGLGNFLLGVGHSIAIGFDVVVIAADGNQAGILGEQAVVVVSQLTIFGHDFGCDNRLAFRIEAVVAAGQQIIVLDDIVLLAGDDLAALGCVVVVIADLDQASRSAHALNVVVAVDDAAVDNHLTVCAELVGRNREVAIGLLHQHLGADGSHGFLANEVVVIANLDQAGVGSPLAVLVVDQQAILFRDLGFHQALAVIAEAVDTSRYQIIGLLDVDLGAGSSDAAFTDVVVRTFVEDQALVLGEHTINVVDQLVVFLHQFGGPDHLAVLAEAVHANGHQAIGLVHTTLDIGFSEAFLTDVVVVLAHLDQAFVLGQHAVLEVVQRAVLVSQALVHDDLAILVEVVDTGRQQVIGLGDLVHLVSDDLAALASVVVLTVDLDQTGFGLHAVDVVVAIDDALVDDHLAIRAELVGILREVTVGLLHQHGHAGNSLAVTVNVVVIVLDLDQALAHRQAAVLVVVERAVFVGQFRGQDRRGVLREAVDTSGQQVIVLHHINLLAGFRHAILVDVVVGAFVQDQASVLAQRTVDVVALLAVLLHQFGGQNSLALFVEAVDAGRQQVVVLGDFVFRINNRSTVSLDVVVVALNGYQARILGELALLVVNELAVLGCEFGIHVSLTISAEAIDAAGHQAIGLHNIVLAVHDGLRAFADVVVSSILTVADLDQTGVGGTLTILVVVQRAILVHDLSGHDHVALLVEAVSALGHQTIGLGHPVGTIHEADSAAANIVVVAFEFDHASVVDTPAVLVVVERAALVHDAGGHDHAALLIEAVSTSRYRQTIQLTNPVGLVDDGGVIVVCVVVVVTNLVQAKLVRQRIDLVILNVVELAFPLVESAVCDTDLGAGFAEFIPVFDDRVSFLHGADAGEGVVVLEEVLLAVQHLPALLVVVGTVVVLQANAIVVPDAAQQAAVLELIDNIVEAAVVVAVDTGARCKVEQVPCVIQHDPALEDLTQLDVIGNTIHHMLAGVGLLADVDAIGAEVVEQTFNVLHAGMVHAVNVVAEAAVLVVPAVLERLHQGVGIRERNVGILEVAALLAGEIRVHKRLQTECCLILGLLTEGVQAACAHVDLVADLTAVDGLELVLFSPLSIRLGNQFQTGHHAQGVGLCLGNGLRLVNPVQNQGQGIVFLVVDDLVEGEVVIDQLHFAVINSEVGVNVDLRTHRGQNTDTFCQLEQEGPCAGAFHIVAGQHVDQIVQTLRDRDLRHIQRQDVGGHHVLLRIDDVVGAVVRRVGVGHSTLPCQETIAAGSPVKVEAVFALLVQDDLNAGVHFIVFNQGSSNADGGNLGFLHRNELHTFHRAHRVIAEREGDIVCSNGNFLALVAGPQRQFHGGTVHRVNLRLGEVQLIGHNHMHGLLANRRFTQLQVHIHSTVVQTDQDASIGDVSHHVIGYLPAGASGQVNHVTRGAQALGAHLDFGADGQVSVIRFDQRVIKLGGTGCSGDHEQTGGDAAGSTVGGLADHGQSLGARLACNEGGGAAAVQVNSLHTAGVLHDLGDFSHAAAAAPGLLATIKDHEDDLTGPGDTDCRTACAVIVVAAGGRDNDLAVLHQHGTKACNCLVNLAVVDGIPLLGGTDHSVAVLMDAEEAVAVDRVVDTAMHDQQTTGLTGTHVIACTVDTGNDIEVLDILFIREQRRVLRITVELLDAVCLIQHTGHTPLLGVTVLVAGDHMDVIAAHIRIGQIVNHLLAVRGGGSLVDFHGDTGRQSAVGGFKHVQALVGGCVNVVASQLTQVVSKGIADSLTGHIQVVGVVELTGALQGRDDTVAGVSGIHSLTDSRTGRSAVQAVGQQVFCTIHIVQVRREVAFKQRGHVARFVVGRIQVVHDVEGVKVTVNIGHGERIGVVEALAQQILADHRDQGFEVIAGAGDHIRMIGMISSAQQVDQVACPAADISVVHTTLVVIGNVHRTKHMADVHPITVGQGEFSQILQAGNLDHLIGRSILCVDLVFLLGNELGKASVFIAGHDAPGAGVVAVNTSTDVLDDQCYRISAGILPSVLHSPLLQIGQISHEFRVGGNRRLTPCRDRNLGGVTATAALFIGIPAFRGKGGILGSILRKEMSAGRFYLLGNRDRSTNSTLLTFRQTRCITHGRDSFQHNFSVSQSFALCVATSVFTDRGLFTSGIRHVVFQKICVSFLAARTGCTGVQTGFLAPQMTTFNGLLCNQYLSANGAVLTFRQTITVTGFINLRINDFGVSKCRNDKCINRTTATHCTANRAFTILSTGRLNDNLHSLPGMGGRQLFLGLQHFITDFTMAAFRQTSRGTGRLNRGINHRPVRCLDRLFHGFATAVLTGLGQDTRFSTGIILGDLAFIPAMTQRRSFFLSNQNLGAAFTMLALSLTGFGTGSSNRFIDLLVVTQSRHNFLSNQRLGAALAVHTFAQTRLGTGSCNGFIDLLIVAQRRNNFLSNQDFTTDRAVRAFLLTGFGTGGINSRIRHSGMALGIDGLLRHQNLAAGLTMRTLGLAGFGTGGLNARIGNFDMAICRNLFLSNQNLVTDRAVRACRLTGFGTGGLNARIHCLLVAICRDFFLSGQRRITDIAVRAFGQTGFGTSGSLGRENRLRMAQRIHNSLCSQRGVTHRAVLAFRQTSIGTGRCNGRINDFGMAGSSDGLLFSQNRVADRALHASSLTRFSTGGSNRRDCLFGMTGSGDISLSNGNDAADRTLLAGGLTNSRTGGSNRRNIFLSMTLRRDVLLLGNPGIADRALYAVSQTSGRTGRSLTSDGLFGMARCRHSFLLGDPFLTDRALDARRLTSLGTGGSNSCNIGFGMALCFNSLLLHMDQFTTVTPAARSQTGFSTGRGLCRQRGVLMAQRIHRISSIGVALVAFLALRTGVGRVAVLRTGGGSHNGIVVVAQRIHGISSIAVAFGAFLTLLTGVGRVAILRTGGGSHNGIVVVAQSVHRISSIAVAFGAFLTLLTSVGRVAVLRTGGSSHNGVVVMAQSVRLISNVAVALGAFLTLLTGVGRVATIVTGGGRHNGIVVMAQSVRLISNVAVALGAFLTLLTGVGRVAAIITGGSRHNGIVLMAQSIHFFRLGVTVDISGTALLRTGEGLHALVHTSGLSRDDAGIVGMLQLGSFCARHSPFVTDRALHTSGIAHRAAGRCNSLYQGLSMAAGCLINGIGINPFSLTGLTDIGDLAVFQTGLFGNDLAAFPFVIVTSCINVGQRELRAASNITILEGTGVGGIAHLGASRRLAYHAVIPDMAFSLDNLAFRDDRITVRTLQTIFVAILLTGHSLAGNHSCIPMARSSNGFNLGMGSIVLTPVLHRTSNGTVKQLPAVAFSHNTIGGYNFPITAQLGILLNEGFFLAALLVPGTLLDNISICVTGSVTFFNNNSVRMLLHINLDVFEPRLADLTVLAAHIMARRRTGRVNRGIESLDGVMDSRNGFLLLLPVATHGALVTIGQTGFRTGRFGAGHQHIFVVCTSGVDISDDILRAAFDVTVLIGTGIRGFTLSDTGRSLGLHTIIPGMHALCINDISDVAVALGSFLAAGTGIGRVAIHQTGRLSHNSIIVVLKRIHLLSVAVARNAGRTALLSTGKGLHALVQTGGLSRDDAIVIHVLQSVNRFRRVAIPLTAAAALDAASLAGGTAHRRDIGNSLPIMTQLGQFFNVDVVTVCTFALFLTLGITLGFNSRRPLAVDMRLGFNRDRLGLLADRALQYHSTAVCTIGCLVSDFAVFVNHFLDADRIFRHHVGMVAGRINNADNMFSFTFSTDLVDLAVLTAGSVNGLLRTVLMAQRNNRFSFGRVTAGTGLHSSTILSTAGGDVLAVNDLHADGFFRQFPGMLTGGGDRTDQLLIRTCSTDLIDLTVFATGSIKGQFFAIGMISNSDVALVGNSTGFTGAGLAALCSTGCRSHGRPVAPGMLAGFVTLGLLDVMTGSFSRAAFTLTGVLNVASHSTVDQRPAILIVALNIGSDDNVVMTQRINFLAGVVCTADGTNAAVARLRTGSRLTILIPGMARSRNGNRVGMSSRVINSTAGVLALVGHRTIDSTVKFGCLAGPCPHPLALAILHSVHSRHSIVMVKHGNLTGRGFGTVAAGPNLQAFCVTGSRSINLVVGGSAIPLPLVTESINGHRISIGTVSTIVPFALVEDLTSFGTSGFFAVYLDGFVLLYGDLVVNRPGITIRAEHAAFSMANGVTGCCYGLLDCILVSNCFNDLLLNKDRIAGLTVAALSQASLCTSLSNSFVDLNILMLIKCLVIGGFRCSTAGIRALVGHITVFDTVGQHPAIGRLLHAFELINHSEDVIRTIGVVLGSGFSTINAVVPFALVHRDAVSVTGGIRMALTHLNNMILLRLETAHPNAAVFAVHSALCIAVSVTGGGLALRICHTAGMISRDHLVGRHLIGTADSTVFVLFPAGSITGSGLGLNGGVFVMLAVVGIEGNVRLADLINTTDLAVEVIGVTILAAIGTGRRLAGHGGILRSVINDHSRLGHGMTSSAVGADSTGVSHRISALAAFPLLGLCVPLGGRQGGDTLVVGVGNQINFLRCLLAALTGPGHNALLVAGSRLAFRPLLFGVRPGPLVTKRGQRLSRGVVTLISVAGIVLAAHGRVASLGTSGILVLVQFHNAIGCGSRFAVEPFFANRAVLAASSMAVTVTGHRDFFRNAGNTGMDRRDNGLLLNGIAFNIPPCLTVHTLICIRQAGLFTFSRRALDKLEIMVIVCRADLVNHLVNVQITDVTVLVRRVTGLHTGRHLFRINGVGIVLGMDHLLDLSRLIYAAQRTGTILRTDFLAVCSLDHIPLATVLGLCLNSNNIAVILFGIRTAHNSTGVGHRTANGTVSRHPLTGFLVFHHVGADAAIVLMIDLADRLGISRSALIKPLTLGSRVALGIAGGIHMLNYITGIAMGNQIRLNGIKPGITGLAVLCALKVALRSTSRRNCLGDRDLLLVELFNHLVSRHLAAAADSTVLVLFPAVLITGRSLGRDSRVAVMVAVSRLVVDGLLADLQIADRTICIGRIAVFTNAIRRTMRILPILALMSIRVIKRPDFTFLMPGTNRTGKLLPASFLTGGFLIGNVRPSAGMSFLGIVGNSVGMGIVVRTGVCHRASHQTVGQLVGIAFLGHALSSLSVVVTMSSTFISHSLFMSTVDSIIPLTTPDLISVRFTGSFNPARVSICPHMIRLLQRNIHNPLQTLGTLLTADIVTIRVTSRRDHGILRQFRRAVMQRRNDFPTFLNRAAHGACLTGLQTGGRTIRLNAFQRCLLIMLAGSRNLGVIANNDFAYGTPGVIAVAFLDTRRRLAVAILVDAFGGVIQQRQRFRHGFAAATADAGLRTCSDAGRGSHGPFSHVVAQRINRRRRYLRPVAHGALQFIRCARSGAGGRCAGNHNILVMDAGSRLARNHFGLSRTAFTLTGFGNVTSRRTGRFGLNGAAFRLVVMAQLRDDAGLHGCRAVCVLTDFNLYTVFSTGCGLVLFMTRILHIVVSGGILERLGLVVTILTGRNRHALAFTGRGRHIVLVIMIDHSDHILRHSNRTTDRALLALRQTGSSTGSRHSVKYDLLMTRRLNGNSFGRFITHAANICNRAILRTRQRLVGHSSIFASYRFHLVNCLDNRIVMQPSRGIICIHEILRRGARLIVFVNKGTLLRLIARRNTGCGNIFTVIFPSMTQCRYYITDVFVATLTTGVCGVAAFGTRGRLLNAFIDMRGFPLHYVAVLSSLTHAAGVDGISIRLSITISRYRITANPITGNHGIHLLLEDNGTAITTLLALSQTSCLTGRSHCSNRFLIFMVTIALNGNLTAGITDNIHTGVGFGIRVAKRRIDFSVTDRTYLRSRTSGCIARSVGKRSRFQLGSGVALACTTHNLHRRFRTGRRHPVAVFVPDCIFITGSGIMHNLGNRFARGGIHILLFVALPLPRSVHVHKGYCAAGVRGEQCGRAVSIAQRRHRDININIIGGRVTLTNHLSHSLSALGQDDLRGILRRCCCRTGTEDVCTTGRGVCKAIRAVHRTIDLNRHVNKVSRRTIVSTPRCIRNRNEHFVGGAGITRPFVCVVDIYIGNVIGIAQRTDRSLFNNDLGTRQHRNILTQMDCTVIRNIYGNVALDWQFIILGLDGHTSNGHGNRGNRHHAGTAHRDNQAVSRTIIPLRYITSSQREHGVAAADERNRSAMRTAVHEDRGITVFSCTRVQGHRNFNVLDIILIQRENALVSAITIYNARSRRTAAEIHELEVLIDVSAAGDSHRTGTGNKAPRVQGTVDSNITALLHPDKADRARRTTSLLIGAARMVLRRQAHGAVNGQRCTLSHRQSAVRSRGGISNLRIAANPAAFHHSAGRRSGVQCIGIIEGNQHSVSARNSILSRQQYAVSSQRNLLDSRILCRCDRIV